MPAPLIDETEKVQWRINSADMDILRLLYPGKVNTVAREIIHEFCQRIRMKVQGVNS